MYKEQKLKIKLRLKQGKIMMKTSESILISQKLNVFIIISPNRREAYLISGT